MAWTVMTVLAYLYSLFLGWQSGSALCCHLSFYIIYVACSFLYLLPSLLLYVLNGLCLIIAYLKFYIFYLLLSSTLT